MKREHCSALHTEKSVPRACGIEATPHSTHVHEQLGELRLGGLNGALKIFGSFIEELIFLCQQSGFSGGLPLPAKQIYIHIHMCVCVCVCVMMEEEGA